MDSNQESKRKKNASPSRITVIYVYFLQKIQDRFFPDENFKKILGILEMGNGNYSDDSSDGDDASSKANDGDEGDEMEEMMLGDQSLSEESEEEGSDDDSNVSGDDDAGDSFDDEVGAEEVEGA